MSAIQGRDCLIQKFRNSSVMLERREYRPVVCYAQLSSTLLLLLTDIAQLYRTGRGVDAGTEEEFPQPDNHAKLRRSCDNAEHVGLYLPESPTRRTFVRTDGLSTIPPPRNQRAGGAYTRPAQTRGAIAFNRTVEVLGNEVQHEDHPYLSSSPDSPSPTCEHTCPMRA